MYALRDSGVARKLSKKAEYGYYTWGVVFNSLCDFLQNVCDSSATFGDMNYVVTEDVSGRVLYAGHNICSERSFQILMAEHSIIVGDFEPLFTAYCATYQFPMTDSYDDIKSTVVMAITPISIGDYFVWYEDTEDILYVQRGEQIGAIVEDHVGLQLTALLKDECRTLVDYTAHGYDVSEKCSKLELYKFMNKAFKDNTHNDSGYIIIDIVEGGTLALKVYVFSTCGFDIVRVTTPTDVFVGAVGFRHNGGSFKVLCSADNLDTFVADIAHVLNPDSDMF